MFRFGDRRASVTMHDGMRQKIARQPTVFCLFSVKLVLSPLYLSNSVNLRFLCHFFGLFSN